MRRSFRHSKPIVILLFGLSSLLLNACPQTSTQDELDMSQVGTPKHAEESSAPQSSASATFPTQAGHPLYRCPMHPQIVQDHPGHCPICGMKLEPFSATNHQHNPSAGSQSDSLQARAAVQINPTRQQLIGVKTTRIQKRQAQRSIRTVAQIAYNEEKLSHVHTKYAGWIEKVYANFTGQYVRKGQPLLEIYSPDLVAAQEEYLVALKTAQQFQGSDFDSTRETSQSLLRASEEKLRLYDLTPAQIQRLRQTGQTQRHLTLFAPSSGYIIDLKALQGMRVTAGTPLYTLVDLSTVWVLARVYENDLSSIRRGQKGHVTLPFLPGSTYQGQVSYVDPYLDPKTRTAIVRVVLPNPKGELKPEMFANLEIEVQNSTPKLMIPASAVIDTGREQWAFVAKGQGRFEPVKLRLGQRLGEDYELLQGPAVGTEVVTQAQFLVDSESQMQAVVSQMTTETTSQEP